MSQEELISIISERAGISRQTVGEIVQAFGEIWRDELLSKGELQLDTIGDFYIDHRPGHRGVDTEAREIFIVPPQDYISFLPTRDLMFWSNKAS
jgi:nucleoid DNA-binding protein